MKKSAIPYFTKHHLLDSIANNIRHDGLLRGYTDNIMKPSGSNYFAHKEGKLLVRAENVNQIIWFEDKRIEGKFDTRGRNRLNHELFILAEEISCVDANSAIEKRLGLIGERKNKFYQIFKEYKIRESEILFYNSAYKGSLIQADLEEVPLGKENRISSNLSIYLENCFLRPIIQARHSATPTSVWYEHNKELEQ